MASQSSLARFVCLSLALALACEAKPPAEREPAAAAATAKQAAAPAPIAAAETAKVGSPAPDFELGDLDGKKVKLSSFKGKTVVLEWFNPECPFVKKSHGVGSLVDTAARHGKNGV